MTAEVIPAEVVDPNVTPESNPGAKPGTDAVRGGYAPSVSMAQLAHRVWYVV